MPPNTTASKHASTEASCKSNIKKSPYPENVQSALHENDDVWCRKLPVEELEQKQACISIFTEIFTSHHEKSINNQKLENGKKNKVL